MALRLKCRFGLNYNTLGSTAVETVGTFLKQALKSSKKEEGWLRFFALMGSVIAIREHGPSVAETPTDKEELLAELQETAGNLQVESRPTA
jgi:hypothetical protein